MQGNTGVQISFQNFRPAARPLGPSVDALPVEYEHLSSGKPAEGSAAIKSRVQKARDLQYQRLGKPGNLQRTHSHRAGLLKVCP